MFSRIPFALSAATLLAATAVMTSRAAGPDVPDPGPDPGAAPLADLWTDAPLQLAAHDHAVTATRVDTITVTGRGPLSAADAARQALEHVPGATELIEADQWRHSAARTLKDVLDYSAGVFVQPKWGEDARLSIRGSGLSRNFHLRGVALLVDGIPMNAADGSADFQEIDPTAFAYSEVYKGANALRYGANSLGGALNFASPTGRTGDALSLRADAGSFDLQRAQVAGGGQRGAFDAHASASWLQADGFRDHSDGESLRGSANFGWRLTPNLETRLYVMGADIDQRIPGSLSREQALRSPRSAAPSNLDLDYQRNIQSWRVASKTSLNFGASRFEVGGYSVEKRLIHPIFQYLDYDYRDHGAFLRATFEQSLAGYANRLIVGLNLFDGQVDNQQFRNLPGGVAGELLSASKDRADNRVLYVEDQFSLKPTLTVVAGLQWVDATRRRADRFDDAIDTSGRQGYDLTSPRLGLLWQPSGQVQVFANISKSAEAPTFAELNFTNAALARTRAQRATTVEIGTRGQHGALGWDVAVYRAELRGEFQFFDLGEGRFAVTNADDTVHQGIEVAGQWTFARDLLAAGDQASWKLAYTHNDFFFDNDPAWGDNRLPGAPRHLLRSQWQWTTAAGFFLAPNLEWVPQGYDVDNANTVQTRDYALFGLRAGFDPGRRWSVFVDARNLADARYIASTSVTAEASPTSALFEPGDGISLVAGLRLHW